MSTTDTLVRFDWAIKRLLRNKADYCIVEGLLTALIGRKILIRTLLESEGNQEAANDKFNRVDILAEDEDKALYIFEVQNTRELDYFHRMAYGTSKAMAEYIKKGEPYSSIRKIYSVNIVYFDLGQGKDYVYRGTTTFVGLHDEKDILQLSAAQRNAFGCNAPDEIFPEYYLLRVEHFDKVATTPLDEWISFLKTGDIPNTATAPGLQEARERLRLAHLSAEERDDYYRMMENLRYQRSVIDTGRAEGRAEGLAEGRAEGLAEGRAEGHAEGLAEGRVEGRAEGLAEGRAEGELSRAMTIASNLKSIGMPIEQISAATGLSEAQIAEL